MATRDSVATVDGGRAIVDAALDAWGRVDIVINNAGQARMGAFDELTEAAINTLIDTQIRGVLNVSRPAWRFMKGSGGGRFVNVSSGSAFGIPGGSVYGMAKMGVIGLTRAMAAEGAALGIRANVIAPYAKTRRGTGMGPIPWSEELADWLSPAKVAPVVAWLAHDSCLANGECFSVGAGHVARVSLSINDGFVDRDPTIESVADHADQILGGPTTEMTLGSAAAMARMFDGFDGPSR